MRPNEETALIEAMCLTWRHDFGLPAPNADPHGRMTWSDGLAMGMSQSQRDGLRLQMRQLVQHHLRPAILAERERCAKVAEAHQVRCDINACSFTTGGGHACQYGAGFTEFRYDADIAAAIRQGEQ